MAIPTRWQDLAQEVRRRAPGTYRIAGEPASGQSAMARWLRDQPELAVALAPPAEHPDAIGSILYQWSCALGVDEVDLAAPTSSVTTRLLDAASSANRTVVLHTPDSWARGQSGDGVIGYALAGRRRELLECLNGQQACRVVLLGAQEGMGTELGSLERPRFSSADIDAFPTSLRPHARDLAKELGAGLAQVHASTFRLGVGLLEREYTMSWVAKRVAGVRPSDLAERWAELADVWVRDLLRSDRERLAAVSAARKALPQGTWRGLLDTVDDERKRQWQAILATTWNQVVEVAESIRAKLALAALVVGMANAHDALATCYRESVISPAEVAEARFERTFHGLQLSDLPKDIQLLTAEHYWLRGRFLSRELAQHARAAEVFREGVARFPNDAYCQHYLAWNLDQLGRSPEEVERHYLRARALEPSNPWFNSRLITFYIDRGRPGSAEQAWEDARRSTRKTAQTSRHLYRWVAHAWLDAGEAMIAKEVHDAMVPSALDRDVAELLRQHVEDAFEVEQLTESVYPPGFPVDERWVAPRQAPHEWAAHPRTSWYPGRVRSVTPERVDIVFADPTEEHHRAYARALSPEACQEAGWDPKGKTDHYVEIAEYGDRIRVFDVPQDELPPLTGRPDPGRYRARRIADAAHA